MMFLWEDQALSCINPEVKSSSERINCKFDSREDDALYKQCENEPYLR